MKKLNPWEFNDQASSYKGFAVADFGDEHPFTIVAEDAEDGTLVTVEDYSDELVSLVVGQIANKSLREMRVVSAWYPTLAEAMDELRRLWEEYRKEDHED